MIEEDQVALIWQNAVINAIICSTMIKSASTVIFLENIEVLLMNATLNFVFNFIN